MYQQQFAQARADVPSAMPTPAADRVPSAHGPIDRVTIVAHDLRNYLAPISTRLQMISRRAQRDGREQDLQLAAGAVRTIEQMTLLIENLLDVARIEQDLFDLEAAPLDLALLAGETADLLRTDSTPIQVEIVDRPLVHGDRERLRQALHNLLCNALRHSPIGVPVVLRVAPEPRAERRWAVVTVRDHGSGIPPQLLPQLFERFVAGPGSGGLGLGLYLTRAIVEAHGGALAVQSAAGAGACFELALPMCG